MKITRRRFALAALLCAMIAPEGQAQIKHIGMRVEGMT